MVREHARRHRQQLSPRDGAAPADALNGIAGLGVMYRSSERLSTGFGVRFGYAGWEIADRIVEPFRHWSN